MTLFLNAPAPLGDRIIRLRRKDYDDDRLDPLEGHPADTWVSYFVQRDQVISQAAVRIQSVSLTDRAASISATDFSGGALAAGLYQIQYYARITQAATTSSSLGVTFNFTDGAVTPSYSFAAITGNTTTTIQSDNKLIHISGSSPVRYSTTYASAGATSMKYALYITLTQINA